MAIRLCAALFALFMVAGVLEASAHLRSLKPSFSDAISGLKETVAKALGSQGKGWEISGFDSRDAFAGHSMVYEFHVEVDNEVFPIRLLEDVNWSEVLNHPVFSGEGEGEGNEVVEIGRIKKDSGVYPVLPPFQLAGPMELWIKDGDDMRLSLPHDVEAGVLKKVILSDGAIVTVKGAKSVSLRHPIELPLPFNHSGDGEERSRVASSLMGLAEALRDASRKSKEKPLLSLRIEAPTSLTSSSSTPTDGNKGRLKLKRLAPGLVELSSAVPAAVPTPVVVNQQQSYHAHTLWPFTSLNASNMNLRGVEELLASVLGEKEGRGGAFRLVKAQVSGRTYVKLSFRLTKRLSDGEMDLSGYPEWRTRPERVMSHFEVLARVEGKGNGEVVVIPERIAEVQPFEAADTVLDSVLTGNVSMSTLPSHHPPPSFFTL